MAATLDKSKPYGTIFNDDEGRAYEQGGEFFRGDGSLWEPRNGAVPDPNAEPVKPAPRAPKAKPAPADEQLSAQLGEGA